MRHKIFIISITTYYVDIVLLFWASYDQHTLFTLSGTKLGRRADP